MTRHERVLAALELRVPDRVPTFDFMSEHTKDYEILGKKSAYPGIFFTNPYLSKGYDLVLRIPLSGYLIDAEVERLAYLNAAAAAEMGYDSAWVSYFPTLRFRDTKTVVDINGRLCDVAIDEKGNLTNPIYREGLLKSAEDWKAWDKRPLLRLPDKVNRVFSGIVKEYGDRFFIFGFSHYGLFESIWQPMGFERFAVAVRKDRDLIRRMVAFYTDLLCMMYEAMADAGLPAVVYTDDLGYRSGPMFNPRVLEEVFGDAYRRIAGTAHSLGMKILMHSCGNVTALLGWFADCGFDAVHPLEPTAGMSLTEAKRLVGERMCLIGNLDVSHILVDATRDEVFEAVRQCIRDAGSGGGYIIGPDHNHPGVSVERLRWMLEAAEKHGRY